jgi:hypothetical protein
MSRLWWSQIKAVVRLEMKKTFFAKRGIWIYLLALGPIVLFAGHAIESNLRNKRLGQLAQQNEKRLTEQDFAAIKPGMTKEEAIARLGRPAVHFSHSVRRRTGPHSIDEFDREVFRYATPQSEIVLVLERGEVAGVHQRRQGCDFGEDSVVFATVFQFFYLRLAVFFGCLGIFMNLFRGELLDKSLHFYFLAPMRREVLMVGKYLAGLVAAIIIFTTSTALQMLVLGWHFDSSAMAVFFSPPDYYSATRFCQLQRF